MTSRHHPHAAVRAYLDEVQGNLKSGLAKELTHRRALQNLLEALNPSVTVIHEGQHIIDVGAPDFRVRRRGHADDFLIGCVETKDIGEDLDKIEKSEQMERYLRLSNVLLTDYLEFRWYVDHKRRLTARLGDRAGKRIRLAPDGEEEVVALLSQFLSETAKDIATPQELAEQMANLAHLIRNLILGAFRTEKEQGKLHKEFQAFRETLIPDLKAEQFADMYAQTIAYGLFAARCQPKTKPEQFTRAGAADLIPRTNPFLRRLFREIAFELDERIQPFVDELVALLRRANIGGILADFGKRTAKEDPVVHFYEDFLQEYDPKVREMRGVYYTPEPVVSYIVRSVDHLLKTKFNKPLGLADKDVLILDPACGTGTFLYYVIQQIHQTLLENGQGGQWNSYVSENLLKRVFGFELLMAPYAVAHLKLGLQLQDLGYKFESDERLGIYLTNTLEEAVKRSELLFAQYIADEANAASEIKRDKPIMVVLGNPPYSGISANRGAWITQMIVAYRQVDGKPLKEKKVWLSDDYVKFIAFGEWRINKTKSGILAFVTNHGYLDNPTFRGMRQHLSNSFQSIYVLDLHGNTKKREQAPDGSKDQNVFDIQQGVAIGVFLRDQESAEESHIYRADLWGNRESKNQALRDTSIEVTKWNTVKLSRPMYSFEERRHRRQPEYEGWFSLRDIFPVSTTGIITARDDLVLGFDDAEVMARMQIFCNPELSDGEVAASLALTENYAWRVSEARRQMAGDAFSSSKIQWMLYRPFNLRRVFYDPAVVWRTRYEVMKNMLGPSNIALLATRQTKDQWDLFSTRVLAGHKSLSAYDITSVFPLYIGDDDDSNEGPQASLLPDKFRRGSLRPNLNAKFTQVLETKMGVATGHRATKHEAPTSPENVLAWIYSVAFSNSFRKRYGTYLLNEFARIPLTSDKRFFWAMVEKGHELVSLHLMESPKLRRFITRYEQLGDHTVEKVRYVEPNSKAGIAAGRVYINPKQYFEGVPKDVWEFHIGGYQVCEKWLKDRKGRQLSSDDIDHYQKIVVALSETIRLMREIDQIIPGWPLP